MGSEQWVDQSSPWRDPALFEHEFDVFHNW